MPVTVLLADKSEVVRVAIRRLFADPPETVALVGEAVDYPQAIQMMYDLQPQVVVLDLHVPRATEPAEVKDRLRKVKVVAISIHSDDEAKALAEAYGFSVLIDKMNLFKQLIPAIEKAALPTDFAATV